jgi:outer membrane protein assembly factor BamB
MHLVATPHPGWSFVGWSGDIVSTANPFDFALARDTSVTPHFGSPINVLAPEHGSIRASTNTSGFVAPLTEVDFTAVPELGYYFAGWTNDATVGAVSNIFGYVHTVPNAVIAAQFAPLPADSVTLTTLESMNGRIHIFSYRGDFPETNRYPLGEKMFMRAIPNPGYAFTGWTGDENGTANPKQVTLDRSKLIGASFEQGYAVEIGQTDGGAINYFPQRAVYPGGTVVTLQAVQSPGFEFAGWSGSVTSSRPTIEVTVNSDVTLFARFRAPARTPAWEFESPSSAILDVATDTQGRIFAADTRGVTCLDQQGNLQWRTITVDGTTEANAGVVIDRSGTVRVLSESRAGGFFGLHRITSDGDSIGSRVNLNPIRAGLSLGRSETAYIGGSTLASVSSNGVSNWDFQGVTAQERGETTKRVVTAPAVGNSNVLFFTAAYGLPAENATRLYAHLGGNELIWSVSLRKPLGSVDFGGPRVIDFADASYGLDATPIVTSDRVYVVDYDGSLLAMKVDGTFLWRFATLDVLNTPSIGADGALYFGAINSNRLYALNRDGSVRWIKRPGTGPYTVPAVGRDGTIYVGDAIALYALDADGNRIWQFDEPCGSPVISGDRLLAHGGSLHAFSLSSAGAAASPWPMRNASPANDRRALVVPPPPQFDLTGVVYSGGTVRMAIENVQQGSIIKLYRSNDFVTWTLIGTQIVDSSGASEFNDVAAGDFSFYRVVRQ